MSQQTIPLSSDARERLLLAIAEQVDPDRIAEVHFFPPIRQGTLETGVAVVAALRSVAEVPERERHVVYTARYRWTRKGPERGKWESEVVAEADAPLVTVEAVVKGVQQRSNDTVEPERVSGDEARARITDARCRTTP
ncbi:MAG: hypothetical protein IPJ78_01100 [Gemmatimonadetes bacterium]|jgi:hypothetical protein|nr:hypothetical protein [Gemmatimonadota bacterium]